MSNYHNIIKKIDKIIIKNGIPYYIKKWKPLKIPNDFDNYKKFILFLKEYVYKYHKHTFINSYKFISNNYKNNNNFKIKKNNDRKIPTFIFDDKTKIGKIIFYHFIGGEDNIEFSKIVNITRKKLKIWNNQNIKGLIIDLTEHFGGNMWCVVDGLKDILGNTTLFSWNNDKTNKNDKKWININNGVLTFNNNFITNKINFIYPIAIIVSQNTSSSGELIASIFLGRKNTKFFGKNTNKTNGLMSVNNTISINNDISINLTEKLITTIDGIFHKEQIIYVNKTSKPIIDAKKWIIQKQLL